MMLNAVRNSFEFRAYAISRNDDRYPTISKIAVNGINKSGFF